MNKIANLFKSKPKKDAYICPELHATITEKVDEGMVPAIIICPICMQKDGKRAMARSLGYQVNQNMNAAIEWYKPDQAQLLEITSSLDAKGAEQTIEAVKKGHLMSRVKPVKLEKNEIN